MGSSSDSDDCQLYTRSAENVALKRKKFREKIDLIGGLENLSDSGYDLDKSINLKQTTCSSASEDEIPLSVILRSLRSKKTKASSQLKQVKSKKRATRQRRNRSNNPSEKVSAVNTTAIDTVVLDDDTGFYEASLLPIDFNSRSKSKNVKPVSDISNSSISNVLCVSSDEDESFVADSSVTVSVEWNNGMKITRKEFKLRRYQKLQNIYEELSKAEGIPISRIILMHDFNSVSPNDSPSSLNFKFYGALTGSVAKCEINHVKASNNPVLESDENKEGMLSVKLQMESQQNLLVTLMKHQKMNVLYEKCSEEIKCPVDRIKITFDGEVVDPNESTTDLDLEGGELFHVYIKK